MKRLGIYSILVSVMLLNLIGCNINKTEKENNSATTFFKKGDRICFVGNSITNMGYFHHDIYLYHVTRFPNQPVRMFNLGVSGDVTGGVLNRMDDDILIHNPTHATIMLGMNDVNRRLYGPLPTTDSDTLKRRKEAVDIYKKQLDKIINIFLSKNIKVILERPSIYDQTAKLPERNHLGVNDVLGECAVYIDSLAAKYKLPVVDFHTIMNRINTGLQKTNPAATLTGPDRIHPGQTGHLVMAYQFLKTEGAPKYVSKIVVDSRNSKTLKESSNCEIKEISKNSNGVSFTVTEFALPFPSTEEMQEGIKLVNFTNELNVELLKVNNLPKGKYQLRIDENEVAAFSAEQLNEGVNLAKFHNTPQYKQAEKVLVKFQELWKMEGYLRGMKFIEYMEDYKACPHKENIQFVETYLDSIFSGYPDPYYKNQLKKYISNKPNETEILKKSEILRDEIYKLAQPVKHLYSIMVIE
jgi:endoglucanase